MIWPRTIELVCSKSGLSEGQIDLAFKIKQSLKILLKLTTLSYSHYCFMKENFKKCFWALFFWKTLLDARFWQKRLGYQRTEDGSTANHRFHRNISAMTTCIKFLLCAPRLLFSNHPRFPDNYCTCFTSFSIQLSNIRTFSSTIMYCPTDNDLS